MELIVMFLLRLCSSSTVVSSACKLHESVCFCVFVDDAYCLDARVVCSSGWHGTEGLSPVPGGRAHRWWTLHNCSLRSNWRRCGPWSLYSGWVLGVLICTSTYSQVYQVHLFNFWDKVEKVSIRRSLCFLPVSPTFTFTNVWPFPSRLHDQRWNTGLTLTSLLQG